MIQFLFLLTVLVLPLLGYVLLQWMNGARILPAKPKNDKEATESSDADRPDVE